MSRRQTRRSVSLKGLTYQRIKAYCDEHGLAVSAYLERLVHADLNLKGRPQEVILRHEGYTGKGAKPGPKQGDVTQKIGGIFSWSRS